VPLPDRTDLNNRVHFELYAKEGCHVRNPGIPAAQLKLESEKQDSQTTLRAAGRINSDTSAVLEKTLRELIPGNKRVVLDLTNVNYIDSSGLGALVSAYMHARRANCDLEIANPRQQIKDLFSTSKLAAVFEGRHEWLGLTPD
jgi:anti-sigma B factor antagonist